MDLGENDNESGFEFWPLQHPTEPPDEDKPLKCPISDTSLLNGRRKNEEIFSDNLPKKATEYSAAAVQKQEMEVGAEESTVRAFRKRHHTLTTHGEHNIVTPLFRMPPIYPYEVPQKLAIFDMMQHFNKFES